MKKQEKKPTTTEQTKPETLADEQISSVAGGGNRTPAVADEGGLVIPAAGGGTPAVVDEGVLAVPGKDSPLPQIRA